MHYWCFTLIGVLDFIVYIFIYYFWYVDGVFFFDASLNSKIDESLAEIFVRVLLKLLL